MKYLDVNLKKSFVAAADCPTVNDNKDHQRMMVDLKFMIVQSFRSFLTAVTQTAVATIAVIFNCIHLYLAEFTCIYLNLAEFT